jgi:dihydropyrimidinase/allantoinase
VNLEPLANFRQKFQPAGIRRLKLSNYDVVIKGGSLVVPFLGVQKSDIGIRGEKIAAIDRDIPAAKSEMIIDASNKYVFPGAIDSHFHVGIYRPLKDDAESESTSAASGGVTTLQRNFT